MTLSPVAAGANKSAKKQFREVLSHAKSYEDIAEFIGGIEGGEDVLKEVEDALSRRDLPLAIVVRSLKFKKQC